MANLSHTATFDDVYQLEVVDDVLGGAGELANEQAQKLGNRDLFLKNTIEGLLAKSIDTTSCVASYPTVVSLTPAHGKMYMVSNNAATYRLPNIATVADNTVFAFSTTTNRTYIAAAVGENIFDPVGMYPLANTMPVWRHQCLVITKPAGATQWVVYLRHGDVSCGAIERRVEPGGPNLSMPYVVCNGAPVSVADYPRLFAKIGYAFGGSGGTFNVPNIAPDVLGGVTCYYYINN